MRFVPNHSLLLATALVVIPSTTLAVFGGPLASVAILLTILLIVVSGFDCMISAQLLSGLKVEVRDLVRCTKGKEFTISLDFSSRAVPLDVLRYGLKIPGEFRAVGNSVVQIRDIPADTVVRSEYPLLPLKRGQYYFTDCYVETTSRFGLWLVRRDLPMEVEVRTYPDLSGERRRLSALFLNRESSGIHARRQVGKGREFEQLREYLPGDDYSDIDWKAMARRGQPVTRAYQIERTQEVYVIVDHSRLSAREIRVPLDEADEVPLSGAIEHGAGGDYVVTTQLERFLHCSLILSSVAQKQGDLFGFLGFADNVDRFIRSRNGRDHYNVVRDALYTMEPKKVAPDFEQLMIFLRQRLTRRALLVMLIDLSDPLTAESFYESIPLISRQHLILVNMVRPEYAHPIFSPDRIPADNAEVYDCLGGHFQWRDLREIKNRLGHLGVELGLPEHEALSTEAVTQYLNVKRRQLI